MNANRGKVGEYHAIEKVHMQGGRVLATVQDYMGRSENNVPLLVTDYIAAPYIWGCKNGTPKLGP